jgi:hypothetical protein
MRDHSDSGNVTIHCVFLQYLINATIFEKKMRIKYTFRFSLQLFSKTFLILRKIQTYIKNVHRYSRKVPIILVIKGKKVKFTLEETMKAQRGSRCIALLFL